MIIQLFGFLKIIEDGDFHKSFLLIVVLFVGKPPLGVWPAQPGLPVVPEGGAGGEGGGGAVHHLQRVQGGVRQLHHQSETAARCGCLQQAGHASAVHHYIQVLLCNKPDTHPAVTTTFRSYFCKKSAQISSFISHIHILLCNRPYARIQSSRNLLCNKPDTQDHYCIYTYIDELWNNQG